MDSNTWWEGDTIAPITLNNEAGGGNKPRRPKRVKITPADDEDVPWSRIRELDDRIEAVSRQRVHVQAALRRRSSFLSYRGILRRARFYFGCGTNDHVREHPIYFCVLL